MSKIQKRYTLFLVLAIVGAVAILTALADWVPEDGHKMHYPQLPDETGWAVNATQPLILADDFMCTETGWIKDVHFWGAWKNGTEGQVQSFILSFHEDIPADQNPDGYSKPGSTLVEIEVTDFVLAPPIDPPTMEGWYDPLTGEIIEEDHYPYFQYNVFLHEEDWFHQDSGTIYWLNISAIVEEPALTQWGWKSTLDHWNDDAVWAEWGDLSWEEMYEPVVVDTLVNDFNIFIAPDGTFQGGGGTGAHPPGWVLYPDDWWTIWYYDHPLDLTRFKEVLLDYEIYLMDPGQPGYVEIAINWSNEEWPDETAPPDPAQNQFIQRAIVYAGPVEPGAHIFPFDILEYNPVWVSVDVRGYNFEIPMGYITHICQPKERVSMDLAFVITGSADEVDTCDFYKSSYHDYVPQGMPDFDMKQLASWANGTGQWTHDGPAALANCIWWFDSKFEPSPIDPRPFFPGPGNPPLNDGYPLLMTYDLSGQWDDHDTNNVQPFIDDLGNNYLNTNATGTYPMDMINGFKTYLNNHGMAPDYRDSAQPGPSYEFIRDEVLTSQDVILLLGFYEDLGTGYSNYLGGHWVTTAGICTHDRIICISDPYLDALEGEPPAGSAHGPTLHNDANNISGPHGQIQHDPYICTSMTPPGWTGPVEVINYPTTTAILNQFIGMNAMTDPGIYGGGSLFVVIDMAYVICPEIHIDSCDYYKAPYGDYSPQGMPDFDQKQSTWTYAATGVWSYCGPVALANCLWWFDSKFEPSPVDPRPFYPGPGNPAPNDGYPLVSSYEPSGGMWDDHDTNNVIPFVDSIALYCKTNTSGSGTTVWDLAQGAQDWIDSVGLTSQYTVRTIPIDPEFGFDQIREEVLVSQDVILLLGFWEEMTPGSCERIGGHYVTVAGTCTDPMDSALCISDPYYDMHEGEPPAGSAHASGVHNDADNISGPHGTMRHDKYYVVPTTCVAAQPPFFTVELQGYPVNAANVAPWYGQNPSDPSMVPVPPQGGVIHTIIEFAVIICPDAGPETGACCEQTTGVCYMTDQATCLGAGHDYKGDGTTCTPNPCDTCDYQTPGDVNNDGAIDVNDISYLVNYLYKGGPAPPVAANADVNGDCCVDYQDVQHLIMFLFAWGPPPVACTCVNPPICLPTPTDHTPGIVRHNTDGYLPPTGDPTGTKWHELYPMYCENWTLANWIDNGDGLLSYCDTVEFIHKVLFTTSREHVKLVTATLTLVDIVTFDTLFVDQISPVNPSVNPITVPIGTFWHEVYPTYCQKYVLAYWTQFTNPSLAVGDQIILQQLPSGTSKEWTVAAIDTDVITTPVPILGDEYDHNLDPGYTGGVPTGTNWLELNPNYGDLWIVDEYRPNSTFWLDYCDTLKFVSEIFPDSVLWKHVLSVTWTMKLVTTETPDTVYMDFMWYNYMLDPSLQPIGTWWHEIYPTLCLEGQVVDWTDNGNGYVDSCDFVEIEFINGPDSGNTLQYHVEAFQVDIVTEIIDAPSCCVIRGDINHSGGTPDISDLVYLVTYMFSGGPPPPCMAEANINGSAGSDIPDISDLVYLVTYMFSGGPPPVPCP